MAKFFFGTMGAWLLSVSVFTQLAMGQMPLQSQLETDFLIDDSGFKTTCERNKDRITLQNGLISRTWLLKPNVATVSFGNLVTGKEMLRSVRPEASVAINEKSYEVGGLIGQPNQAFLTAEWIDSLKNDDEAWQWQGFTQREAEERIKWHRRRHHSSFAHWPPKGIQARFSFTHKDQPGVSLMVCYEMYDGIPAMSKWIEINNDSEKPIEISRFRAEELAVVEQANWVELQDGVAYPKPDYLHVETDFAFGGFNFANANRHVVSWRPDPKFDTQVNYRRQTPCLLVVEPTYGPAQTVPPDSKFKSFHTFELVYDSTDRERRGLTLRKMYRTLAPWVTENPLTHHLLNSRPDQVKKAIQKAANVGFESVILSFGSGFNMENESPEHLAVWRDVADFAEQQGVEIGAYSLFSSRKVGGGNDVVSPEGQRPKFGNAPAATSEWGQNYFRKLKVFFDETGFDQFENDGPYPGDVDVTPRPPLQKGLSDSRWAQWRIVTELYQHLRATGVYINQPDYYFFHGGNKTGMGYRETNWSLPRSQQVIHTRQNIYDGTWTKTPSMGWMHVPLAQYHGGGAAATIEPLHEHLDHYRRMMQCNLGMGVQAHYRGPRLYDTDETREMVFGVVGWYKKYRDILESDIVHGRRADGRGLDWILHVNPKLETCGMLCIWNPTRQAISRPIRVNLYYTGLKGTVEVSESDQKQQQMEMEPDKSIRLNVSVPPEGMSWFVIRRPK